MNCTVWWAPTSAGRPDRWTLPHELERASRYRRQIDRERSVLGSVMLRLAAGRVLDRDPAGVLLLHTCPRCGTSDAPDAHGRPSVAGEDGLSLSLSHSGALVLVAAAGARVGVDVERVRPFSRELLREIPAPGERAPGPEVSAAEATHLWVRKESVLKATGEGLLVEPSCVLLAGDASPRECARLGAEGRPLESGLTWDLDALMGPDPVPDGEHRAAVTVLVDSGAARPGVVDRPPRVLDMTGPLANPTGPVGAP